MLRRIAIAVRNQWMGALALFVALGGTAVAATGALDGPAPGQNSVGSLDIINGQVQNGDIQDNAVGSGKVSNDSLTATDVAQNTLGFRETATSASDEIKVGSIDEWDVADDSLAGADVLNNSLTRRDIAAETLTGDNIEDQTLRGADILPQSGVDTCIATVRIGSLCVRAENSHRTWREAMSHCANLDLRVPTIGEALQLAQTHDIPNVDETEGFWTDETTNGVVSGGQRIETAYIVDDAGNFGHLGQQAEEETVCVMTPVN